MGHGVCAQVLAEAVQGPVCPEVFFMRWAGFGDCRPPCRSVWVGQDPVILCPGVFFLSILR